MKSIDLTQSVMDKVVGFEEKRTKFWVLRIAFILLFLILILIGSAYVLSQNLLEKEVSDLLTIYVVDRDIIENIWQEVSSFIWDTIPHEIFVILTFSFFVLLGVLFFIFRKRRLLARRYFQIKQYKKVHQKT